MTADPAQGDVIVPGERVYLGQIRKDLAPVYRRWLNDLTVAHTLGVTRDQAYPMTDEAEEEWYEAARKDSDNASFTIYLRETGQPIGNCGLMGVRRPNRSAELGIAIGERTAHNKGYGTEAVRLLVDYGFTVLGLHRIWLECVASNPAGLKVYERVGFKEVGRAREAWRMGGKWYDGVIMDILETEFESPVLKVMLGLDTATS